MSGGKSGHPLEMVRNGKERAPLGQVVEEGSELVPGPDMSA